MASSCERCQGTGEVTTPAGRFYSAFTRSCVECGGTGTIVPRPAPPETVKMKTATKPAKAKPRVKLTEPTRDTPGFSPAARAALDSGDIGSAVRMLFERLDHSVSSEPSSSR